jgi:hypothetical protein
MWAELVPWLLMQDKSKSMQHHAMHCCHMLKMMPPLYQALLRGKKHDFMAMTLGH